LQGAPDEWSCRGEFAFANLGVQAANDMSLSRHVSDGLPVDEVGTVPQRSHSTDDGDHLRAARGIVVWVLICACGWIAAGVAIWAFTR